LKGVFKFGSKTAETTTGTWTRIFVQDGVTNIQKISKVIEPVVSNIGKTAITWGNAFKAGVVGVFGYLFLHGGASEVVSTTLGIDENLAQILIWIIAFILILWLVVWFVRWFKSTFLPRSVNDFVYGSNKKYSDPVDYQGKKRYNPSDSLDRTERQAYRDATRPKKKNSKDTVYSRFSGNTLDSGQAKLASGKKKRYYRRRKK